VEFSNLLQDKRIKITLIAIGACLIAYLGLLTWLDKVHRAENTINQFWGLLERSCQERLSLLPELASFIVAKSPQSQPIATALVSTYQQNKGMKFPTLALNDPNELQRLAEQQQAVVATLYQMQTHLPPEILQDEAFQKISQTLEERELQIQFSLHALKSQIVYYNRLVYDFPQRWVNKVVGHFLPKYFPEVPTLAGIEAKPR